MNHRLLSAAIVEAARARSPDRACVGPALAREPLTPPEFRKFPTNDVTVPTPATPPWGLGWALGVSAGTAPPGPLALGASAVSTSPWLQPPAQRRPEGAGPSPLFKAMMEAAQSAAHKGTVDPDLVVSSGNQVLAADIEAPRIFPAMAEMIVRARKSVALELFHWETGTDASRVLLQALRRLEQKQVGCAQPVAVRILVNDHRLRGGRDKAGLERDIQELDLDPRRVRVYTAAHSHTGLGVHHSKLLVIDGQELFLTGANVQEAYDFNNTWYDRGFHFKGPVAHAGRSEFDEAWDKCGGQPSAAAFGPVPAAPRAGDVAMLTASRPANGYLMASGQGYPTDQMFLAAFQLAQQRISVQSPNLNEPAVIDALVDAALRGVHVRIVLSKGFNKWAERVPGLGGANVDTVKLLKDRLARRGLFRWPMGGTLEVRWYSHDGLEPVEGGTDHASHCKYTSIDGSVFCCGSSNMDSFSATYAREFNSVVDSRQETVRADHLFYRVWRRSRPCYRWPH